MWYIIEPFFEELTKKEKLNIFSAGQCTISAHYTKYIVYFTDCFQ
jgi:hypothetical protein